VSQKVVH